MSTSARHGPFFRIDADGVGWIVFDDPDRSLNVLTEDVMRDFARVVARAREAAEHGALRAVILLSGKPDSFIAGADLDAIADLEDPAEAEMKVRLGQAIFQEVAHLPVPTVAAIHGVCVGGGTELSLACDRRILSDADRTKVSLPEVQLGILPAWGGTTRLPRLVGLRAALDLLLTGRAIPARRARGIGFADRVVPAPLLESEARRLALDSRPPARRRGWTDRLIEATAPGRRLVLRAARKRVMATTRGHYPAPLAILRILEARLGGPVEASLDQEASEAALLICSSVCKNLVHVFRMREAARKEQPGGEGVRPQQVESVGILGAGVMGGGIAYLAADRGLSVRLKDVRSEAVSDALRHADHLFRGRVRRRRITSREARERMERISGGVEYHGFGAVDLVVEAIVERLDVKRAVLREVEGQVRDSCVLATNTSSLSVDAMAESLDHPERFCGMHFFNPVHRMPLVEVVRGRHTDARTVATVHALALALGKVPVVTSDGPGFLVNRVLGPYLNEAGHLLADGATIEEIDRAALEFGMPMGPLRLMDEVGLDVARHAGAVLHEALGDRLRPAEPLLRLQASERLGRKNGRGFYRYADGKQAGPDEAVYAELGLPHPPGDRISGDDIRRRLVVQMINEAARALGEGIVRRAADVDLAMVMGTGFPPFRGGLLRFADTLHPRGVLDRAQRLHDAHGERFEPAPLLRDLARDDRTFYAAFPGP